MSGLNCLITFGEFKNIFSFKPYQKPGGCTFNDVCEELQKHLGSWYDEAQVSFEKVKTKGLGAHSIFPGFLVNSDASASGFILKSSCYFSGEGVLTKACPVKLPILATILFHRLAKSLESYADYDLLFRNRKKLLLSISERIRSGKLKSFKAALGGLSKDLATLKSAVLSQSTTPPPALSLPKAVGVKGIDQADMCESPTPDSEDLAPKAPARKKVRTGIKSSSSGQQLSPVLLADDYIKRIASHRENGTTPFADAAVFGWRPVRVSSPDEPSRPSEI